MARTFKETLTIDLSNRGLAPTAGATRASTISNPTRTRAWVPARVIVQQRNLYRLATAAATRSRIEGLSPGRFAHEALEGGLPVTGDWVAVELKADVAIIVKVLPRSTAFTRMAAGTAKERQVVAANVDMALLAASLNADLNLRRLERYLATAYESGATPVILLTKADACDEPEPLITEVQAIAFGVPVLAVSVRTGEGLTELSALLAPGKTAVAAKLLGRREIDAGQCARRRGAHGHPGYPRGRCPRPAHHHPPRAHPSAVRGPDPRCAGQPRARPVGPGRPRGLAAAFAETTAEVDLLAQGCPAPRLRPTRPGEPGCAVQAALADGSLDAERWRSFQKLQRELAHTVRKEDPLAALAERKRWAAIHKAGRTRMKAKREIDD